MSGFAIVTVIHDSEPELPVLLDSIARLPEPRPRVIVVDSGSSGRRPRRWRPSAARRSSRSTATAGFGAGCNAGSSG